MVKLQFVFLIIKVGNLTYVVITPPKQIFVVSRMLVEHKING